MSKSKLEHLTDYILSHLSTDELEGKISAWPESGAIIPNGEDRGNGAHMACHWKYDAVLNIKALSSQLLDPRYVLALVACWLNEHEPERNEQRLSDPRITINLISADTLDISIRIELMEPVELIPDMTGMITWQGQAYRIGIAEIDIAEDVELVDTQLV